MREVYILFLTHKGNRAIFKGILALCGLLYLSIVGVAQAAPTGYVLQIELSPAVCKIDDAQKRMRQCLEGYSLTVSGLYPEGIDQKTCETSSVAALTPVQKRLLMRIMPDENAQARLWRSIGGCVSMNASQYFRMMVNYADGLNMPSEVTTPTSIRVSRDGLQQKFAQLNQGMPLSSVQLNCDSAAKQTSTMLTNIQVCYQTNGNFKTCRVERVASNCPAQFVIQGSY